MSTEELLQEGLVPTPGKRVRRRGLHALTGIRFFAALWVMAFHFGAAFTARAHMPHAVTTFLEHGDLGVALFFMLSGFILYYTYKDNLQTSRDLYKFFVARFARLYPVYFLALVISALIQMKLPHGRELFIFPLLQAWVPPVSDMGYEWVIQAWTLSVEAFFYCCFPLLLLLFRRRWSFAALWSAVAILFALIVALQVPMFHPGVGSTLLTRLIILPVLSLPQFVLGLLLGAIFLEKQHSKPKPASTNDWITVAGLLPCAALVASNSGDYLVALGGVLGFGWAIYRLADGRGWLSSLLSTPLMLLLGGASFSIYILQGLIRILSTRLFAHLHPGLDAALSPLILIGLSCLIFLFYEEPLREVIRKLLVPQSISFQAAPTLTRSASNQL
jgi:peptidoglycan/LPS O-acetylase OafA/YrhL